jgi:hypothetical protein
VSIDTDNATKNAALCGAPSQRSAAARVSHVTRKRIEKPGVRAKSGPK